MPGSSRRAIDGRIWRVDPASGDAELLSSVPWFTNGLAFGLDGRECVAATHTSVIHRFSLDD